jgi:RimJ/RimL family protein N-acetyltransferase
MFEHLPTLRGRLVSMRPVELDDWDALWQVGCNRQVWEGLPHLELHLEEQFRNYFERGLGAALVVATREAGRVIGWSRFSSEFVGPGEIEIGWTFLGRAYWGGEYNSEMKQLMLAHAFRFVDRVIFRIRETNLRSRRAIEKIGAEQLLGRPSPAGSDDGASILFYGISR